MDSNGDNGSERCAPVMDGRMMYEKALEPLSLPLCCRQFLESLRSAQLSDAFLNWTLLDEEHRVSAGQSRLSMLAFANALVSPLADLVCEFLIEQGFDVTPHCDTLLDYLLLASLSARRPLHQEPLRWLLKQGATVTPERRLSWRALENYFPVLFSENKSSIERRELSSLFPSDLTDVREVREVARL